MLFRSATPEHAGQYLALAGASIDPTAKIINHSVIGRNATVAAGATIDGSVLFDGAVVSKGASLKNCFVAKGFEVPANTVGIDNFFGF